MHSQFFKFRLFLFRSKIFYVRILFYFCEIMFQENDFSWKQRLAFSSYEKSATTTMTAGNLQQQEEMVGDFRCQRPTMTSGEFQWQLLRLLATSGKLQWQLPATFNGNGEWIASVQEENAQTQKMIYSFKSRKPFYRD